MPKRMVYSGFTLIEIMIALFIFAILMTLAFVCLHTVIQTRTHLKNLNQKLQAMQIALFLWQKDVLEIIGPLAKSSTAFQKASVHSLSQGVEFITLSHDNPGFVYPQSDLWQVSYVLDHHHLLRLASQIGRQHHHGPAQVLLKGVCAMQIRYLNAADHFVAHWPEHASTPPSLPKAMVITIQLQHWGLVRRIINLSQVSYDLPKH